MKSFSRINSIRKITFLLILCLVYTKDHSSFAQTNTVGTLLNTANAQEGYILFSPRTSLTPRYTYIIDNCGEIRHQWESEFPLFSTDYLMEDGSLYRSVIDNQSTLSIPGNTGRIEHLDWNGNTIWAATISETDFSFHHDFVVLENGNIILLVAFRMTEEEAIERGRDPETISTDELYEERLWEIQPIGSGDYEIVWEWRAWDHLIQDFDDTKLNFGVIADHPELLNFNFGISFGEADWLHSNSISYNPDRDHVTISNRNLSEFIIIDHSTTTEEASGSTGGNSNMGGDIIYRYGNPQSYDQGDESTQALSSMHDVTFIPEGLPNAGQIMMFNNGPDFGFSAVQIIDPEYDETTNRYVYNGGAYGPDELEYEYTDPDNFFAIFLSGSQQLSNGSVLINDGPAGRLFEVDTNGNVVWEYQSPVGSSQILEDNQDASLFQTRIYRALKYPLDYVAFEGRDLTSQGVIELNPAQSDCELLSIDTSLRPELTISPNPADNIINIKGLEKIDNFTIYDLNGRSIKSGNTTRIDIQAISPGIYIIQIESLGQKITKKLIKK